MKSLPKVSILMGIYNCEEMLEECVQSILNQTYTNWELVMCDDGSTDTTFEKAKDLSKRYPAKIKVIKNKTNRGLAYSLNECIKHATGEFLARQDADDFSVPNRLEKQIDFLVKNDTYSWVATGTEIFDEIKVRGVRRLPITPTKYDLAKGAQFCHATTMFKADALKSVNGYNVSWYTKRGQDYDLWMRLYAKKLRGYNLPNILYRVREDNNTYRRRAYKYRIAEVYMRLKGFRQMKLPLRLYIYTVKPIVAGLLPRKIMKSRQELKLEKYN